MQLVAKEKAVKYLNPGEVFSFIGSKNSYQAYSVHVNENGTTLFKYKSINGVPYKKHVISTFEVRVFKMHVRKSNTGVKKYYTI